MPVKDIIAYTQELLSRLAQLENQMNDHRTKLLQANRQHIKELEDHKQTEDLLRLQRDLGIALNSIRNLNKGLDILLKRIGFLQIHSMHDWSQREHLIMVCSTSSPITW